MRIDVDLDNVKEGLEEQWYLVRVQSGEQKTSGNGNEGILWTLEIIDPEEFAGWTLNHWTGLSEIGKRYLKKFLKAAEFEWDPTGFHVEDVEGCELEVYVVPGEGDDFDDITDMRVA